MTRILTVRQPWAELIMTGRKDVENRTWEPSYRGEVVIHAGKTVDLFDARSAVEYGLNLDDLPTGVILGSVDLVDVVSDSRSAWADPGGKHWIFGADRTVLDVPLPWRGALGLREFTEEWDRILRNGPKTRYLFL